MTLERSAAKPIRLFSISAPKVSDILDANKGVGPGFDAIRLLLAFAIFYGHTRFALGGATGILESTQMMPEASHQTVGLLSEIKTRLYILGVPMFFALSGFLVTGSAVRVASVRVFLTFRILRIIPALVVETILSAIILGMFFSALPWNEYVADPLFWRYFGNIVGFISFWLPGVFLDNPVPGLVNVNLWTLPAEFYCYALMALFMLAGFVMRRGAFIWIFGGTTLALIYHSMTTGFAITPSVWSTMAVVYCFFVGIVFFQWREKIPLSIPLLFVCIAFLTLTIRDPELTFLVPIPLTYVVVYFGCQAWLRLGFMKGRDYSYGVYLYGFPITQAIVALYPEIGRYTLLATALPLTIAFAALSWHWIEKPALKLKRARPTGR